MNFFDLSFRYKVPLWGSALIVVTACAVSASLIVEDYYEMRDDMVNDAETLSRTMVPGLFRALRHDDVWSAYEIVSAPVERVETSGKTRAETILVVDAGMRVFAAARPKSAPLLSEMRQLGPEYAKLAEAMAAMGRDETRTVEFPDSTHIYFVAPVEDNNIHLGRLVIVLEKAGVMRRFLGVAWHGMRGGLLILAVLLPINWYWGRRMTRPLLYLATRMEEVSRHLPGAIDPAMYPHRDELGRLFEVYSQMQAELKAKKEMEKQIVQSERLAALGQLAAGVAHEINNPLGGMLTAIDTLRCHSDPDSRTMKTVALIERGLVQIKDTVGGLLVEAKAKSHDLAAHDIDDVRMLVTPQARAKSLLLDWDNRLDASVRLPAPLIRQVMINLLLNAIQAANPQGRVACTVAAADSLRIAVTNDGKSLSDAQMTHLFEPFSPLREGGHGLGLWVTYQIVHQLGGDIAATREEGEMRFLVDIPIASSA